MAKRSQRLRRKRRIERMRMREQEEKLTKVVEDNSVMLENMNNVSSICDNLLQTFHTMADEGEIDFEDEIDVRAPMIKTNTAETEREPLRAPEFLKNMGTGRKPPARTNEDREPLKAPEFLKNMGSNNPTTTNTETKGTPLETPTMLKMLKKDLLKMAKDKGCKVAPSMTKANIIKAIEAKQ